MRRLETLKDTAARLLDRAPGVRVFWDDLKH
jgi:hypothetical protein